MTHILLIDDERKLTDPLRSSFERGGYRVTVANDGHAGLSLALVEKPDVVVLDVMMPGLDGWQVCQAIRAHSTMPIIMLTALDDSTDRIKGLELGADDYLVKPFGYKELEAHVRAMLRRVRLDQGQQLPQRIMVGEIVLDLEAHTVTRSGHELTLRQKEFEILSLLMTNLGKIVTRDRLFDEVWGTDWLGDTRTLDVHMSWLRAKLETDPANPVYLQTIRGVGYRFTDPEGS
ncbi:MAG: response regulator transcription factor [Chloroflexi bacterium]|uniref:response regulator transcription factor n=1 Tax=Candidatus Flexifilum breve TaxID=3140694 RepID=UPI00313479C3|nr:response regulator transcription factor [Chloroflexota bacterium]